MSSCSVILVETFITLRVHYFQCIVYNHSKVIQKYNQIYEEKNWNIHIQRFPYSSLTKYLISIVVPISIYSKAVSN